MKLLLMVLLVAGMAFAQGPEKPPPVEGRSVTSTSGLEYWDIKEGTGRAAKTGDTVSVHYTGWLESTGKKFDSSLDRNQPLDVTIGSTPVIRGWTEGLKGMKAGGKRRLKIPSELGYGSRGAGRDIPPNATLIFDIEVLSVR